MTALQTQYSKEIAKALGKIAVYLPGEAVRVGDIITFPYGRTGIFNRKAPLGTFKKITSLKHLGIDHNIPRFSKTPDTYQFTSQKSVAIDYDLGAEADLGADTLPGGKGKLNIRFSAVGGIYFLAIDCDKKEFGDITFLEKEINSKGKKLLWQDTYLVTSVTIAKKALIAISRSKTSELVVEGNIKGIQSGPAAINANTVLHIKKQKGNIFIKDWSDDVTVFMDLMKFEKELFEAETYRSTNPPDTGSTEKIVLKPVAITALLD
ncbi:MAG: hypothetical protein AAF934_09520 [Bacteroidota bacterium]